MAEYKIHPALHEQTLAELRRKFGAGAERVFYTSWQYATEANDKHAPKKKTREEIEAMYPDRPGARPEVVAHMRAFKERQVARSIEEAERVFKLQSEIHRNNLLAFFTMDGDVSRALAEKIVDGHILKK